MRKFEKFGEFRDAVSAARETARREGAKDAGYAKSRGTMLGTSPKGGGQCRPYPGGEAIPWDGSKKELEAVIEKVLAGYPDVETVYVFGGFDGFETFAAAIANDDDYDPWISEWEVVYWTRDAA